jgi:hypothetical protein
MTETRGGTLAQRAQELAADHRRHAFFEGPIYTPLILAAFTGRYLTDNDPSTPSSGPLAGFDRRNADSHRKAHEDFKVVPELRRPALRVLQRFVQSKENRGQHLSPDSFLARTVIVNARRRSSDQAISVFNSKGKVII